MSCANCSCGLKQIEMARTVNKIQIKPKDPSKLMDSGNTAVFMDGIPMRNIREIEVKVGPDGSGIVKIEMFSVVEMDESLVADAEVKCE